MLGPLKRLFSTTREDEMSATECQGAKAAPEAKTSCSAPAPVGQLSASTLDECCGAKLCQDTIRERAYLKWETAGYPPGDGVNFWLEAEQELMAEADATE